MGRLLAVGDIHGCQNALRKLLGLVEPRREDTLVFLGDYVDRGSNTRGVIDDLIALQAEYPATVFLRGNHDQLMLDTLAEWGHLPGWTRLRDLSPAFSAKASSSDAAIWLQNGGIQALMAYDMDPTGEPGDGLNIPRAHLDFLASTRLWYERDGFLFVHAGTVEGVPMERQDPYTLLWSRLTETTGSGPIQVIGHSPTADGLPHFETGRIKVDTGACFGGFLTCIDVRCHAFLQATED